MFHLALFARSLSLKTRFFQDETPYIRYRIIFPSISVELAISKNPVQTDPRSSLILVYTICSDLLAKYLR